MIPTAFLIFKTWNFCTSITTPKLLSSCGKLCMRRSSKQVLFSFDTSKSISIRSKFWQITTQKTCRLLASTIAGIQNFVQVIFGLFVYEISYRAVTDYFWCARTPHWRPHHLRATAAAGAFYSVKSRQELGLGGLASRGGPDLNMVKQSNKSIGNVGWKL